MYHIFIRLTVQASIGAIALSEGLACGEIVLTASVIAIIFTAPVGAILIDWLYFYKIKKMYRNYIVDIV